MLCESNELIIFVISFLWFMFLNILHRVKIRIQKLVNLKRFDEFLPRNGFAKNDKKTSFVSFILFCVSSNYLLLLKL